MIFRQLFRKVYGFISHAIENRLTGLRCSPYTSPQRSPWRNVSMMACPCMLSSCACDKTVPVSYCQHLCLPALWWERSSFLLSHSVLYCTYILENFSLFFFFFLPLFTFCTFALILLHLHICVHTSSKSIYSVALDSHFIQAKFNLCLPVPEIPSALLLHLSPSMIKFNIWSCLFSLLHHSSCSGGGSCFSGVFFQRNLSGTRKHKPQLLLYLLFFLLPSLSHSLMALSYPHSLLRNIPHHPQAVLLLFFAFLADFFAPHPPPHLLWFMCFCEARLSSID